MTDYRTLWKAWREDLVFDEGTRAAAAALSDEEAREAFAGELTFGTGGLRGVIGVGTNRMNVYTVGRATQGLADFIRSRTDAGSVVIAYDSRHMSAEFALDSACILAANGIHAYLFDGLRPTPELSFAVRHLGATAGIVITASHNPPKYNGYKVYWSDGGQIVPPYDRLIIEQIGRVQNYAQIRRMPRAQAEESGLLTVIGEEVDASYLAAVKANVIHADVCREMGKKLKIVYTPLHGTGNLPVRRVLAELGFEQVWVVPEQELPDGDFSTVQSPNPEDKRAFALALALAKEKDADLVLATDPDADRLGVYAKDGATGEYMPFTGNMSGLLIAEYLLSQREALGLLPADRANGALVTTIVSSNMAHAVANAYGLSVIETLTGFKYIGEQIRHFEEALAANGGVPDKTKGAYVYAFGFEESYGCLIGTHARDKDAVMAVTSLCEAAAFYAKQGKTLWDVMQEMYAKYGCYCEGLESLTLEGAQGREKIDRMMRTLRNRPPAEVGGKPVLAVRDYLAGERRDASGAVSPTGLPKSNVLYFEFAGDGWCCVRPSGTEPKIKFYFGVRTSHCADAARALEGMKEAFFALLEI